jgi:cytochrome b pre-mRNA-processing protein 3
MLERFRNRRRNRQIVDDLYAAIVGESRQEALYTRFALPDTVMGRFEALSIHVFLFLARCRDDATLKPVAQDLVDRFMVDIEDSIREIGIGDPSVPKRMRKLAGMFYERVHAYDPPLHAGDTAALAAALKRHALPPEAGADAAAGLAAYILTRKSDWDGVPTAEIMRGRLVRGGGDT